MTDHPAPPPRGINLIIRPYEGRFIARIVVDDDVVFAGQLDGGHESALDRAFKALDQIINERDPGPLQRWWSNVVASTPGYDELLVAAVPVDQDVDFDSSCTCGPGAAVEYHGHMANCPLYEGESVASIMESPDEPQRIPQDTGERDQLDYPHNQLPLP